MNRDQALEVLRKKAVLYGVHIERAYVLPLTIQVAAGRQAPTIVKLFAPGVESTPDGQELVDAIACLFSGGEVHLT